jgi:GTP-binding protein
MTTSHLPIIALVGPPNAGKSTLMNKIIGGALAVTSDIAGTTRDRQYVKTAFAGREFILADTAGLMFNHSTSARNADSAELEKNIQTQIETALRTADVLIFVVDGKAPLSAIDRQVLIKFRKNPLPKILAVNKLDSNQKRIVQASEFSRLGIKPVCPISALTGVGVGDLLETAVNLLPPPSPEPTTLPEGIKVAIVGKPNVGKSSLFNKILNAPRVVVSNIPGTTRTSIDEHLTLNQQAYTFIDTAGLKKKDHKQSQPDIFSGYQTFKSIRKSDVCLLVLDALEPITVQDQKIAQEILSMQKGCIILVNKVDQYLAEAKPKITRKTLKKGQSDNTYQSLQDYISHHFPFLWMCPVFFVSAKTGEGLSEALTAIQPIYTRRHKQISPTELTTFLTKKLKTQPPKRMWDQKAPKVYNLSQIEINPPTFELLVNFPPAISSQFKHYLENSIIRDLDFYGTPVKIHLKRKAGT